mmetsp:Transcript_27638/g.51530  ORF Transcript_27638/g.51530 Transcript_27638/m.51530 type:complete len:136 (-) Transcript_27638:358-765(-)|eukprot:CAMPEP_0170176702 /NCGR_PEP_ID=MMETSP0040_2-20121228/9521_1 /TAXON_ID=641309 /ORGANISM="Lotharella oceanica, Strain CCMP622" /LENGTH=135 /DNA_ID=CAMNT_0010419115 /DNA_START=390 /DNA_END=797 /DNA_ORIENTATION=-
MERPRLGKPEGSISIVKGHDGKAPGDYQPVPNCVVAHKDPAPHEFERFSLVYRPSIEQRHGEAADDDEAAAESEAITPPYYIWYRIGGGGGHSLHFKNLLVKHLIYLKTDCEEKFSILRMASFACSNDPRYQFII